MKPQNKFQQQIFELSQKLPQINQIQKQWAYNNALDHLARRTKKGTTTCLECGHRWQERNATSKSITCPHCGTSLKAEYLRMRIFQQSSYYCIVTTFKGHQVLRFFFLQAFRKIGESVSYTSTEVVQRWIAPSGKSVTLSKLKSTFFYNDNWQFTSNMEIRKSRNYHDIIPDSIYPRIRTIAEVKRNGFKGDFHNISPFNLLQNILIDNKAETLLKSNQIKLLRYSIGDYHCRSLDEYWASIRICIRNDYTITDGGLWTDYINLLKFFGKDINNAKYVCPQNLKAQHDDLVEKKQIKEEKIRLQKQRLKALENEKEFQELKGKFFGIAFTDGTINVRVLESVLEYMEEGAKMRHCVFSNQYYLKPDTLILSACIDGKRVETIEFSTKTFKVVQCRGICNTNTEHHDKIIQLVNKNAKLIRKRLAS